MALFECPGFGSGPFGSAADWSEEADRMEFEESDLVVAESAELPTELLHHALAANQDPEFESGFEAWLSSFSEDNRRLLAAEQSCDDGILLGWDMRGSRLQSVPREVLGFLDLFWTNCPRHVAVHVAHFIFWLVRAERGRRTGQARWRNPHGLVLR